MIQQSQFWYVSKGYESIVGSPTFSKNLKVRLQSRSRKVVISGLRE